VNTDTKAIFTTGAHEDVFVKDSGVWKFKHRKIHHHKTVRLQRTAARFADLRVLAADSAKGGIEEQ